MSRLTADYTSMVNALAKDGEDILATLTPDKAHAIHMSLGVAGEAGELVDEVKKWVAYDRPADTEFLARVIKEMGDLEFYLEGLRQGLCITRKEVLESNIEKLSERYKDFSYSDKAANERVDVK